MSVVACACYSLPSCRPLRNLASRNCSTPSRGRILRRPRGAPPSRGCGVAQHCGPRLHCPVGAFFLHNYRRPRGRPVQDIAMLPVNLTRLLDSRALVSNAVGVVCFAAAYTISKARSRAEQAVRARDASPRSAASFVLPFARRG